MTVDTLLERITDYANRPDPYPLYAELRAAGVVRQTDGSYLVGTYSDIVALLHDPRTPATSLPRTAAWPRKNSTPSSGSTTPSTKGCAAWPCGRSAPRTAQAGSTRCAARSPGSPRN
jgi:hypothetical protein